MRELVNVGDRIVCGVAAGAGLAATILFAVYAGAAAAFGCALGWGVPLLWYASKCDLEGQDE